jgi:hypothetical protein
MRGLLARVAERRENFGGKKKIEKILRKRRLHATDGGCDCSGLQEVPQ